MRGIISITQGTVYPGGSTGTAQFQVCCCATGGGCVVGAVSMTAVLVAAVLVAAVLVAAVLVAAVSMSLVSVDDTDMAESLLRRLRLWASILISMTIQ